MSGISLARARGSPQIPYDGCKGRLMLAYVFWHTPQRVVEPGDYERLLTAFHQALARAGPDGFLYSAAFRIDAVPWLASDGPAYEDWYLVESSAALDALNEAAVIARQEGPHDEVAAVAGAGAGGVYRLRQGAPDPCSTKVALWLSKQPAQSYRDFYALMAPQVDAHGAAVWGRQMVLGPAPEFCVHAPRDVPLERFIHQRVGMDLVWCEGRS